MKTSYSMNHPPAGTVLASNGGASTPMTVSGAPFSVIGFPIAAGSDERRCSQN